MLGKCLPICHFVLCVFFVFPNKKSSSFRFDTSRKKNLRFISNVKDRVVNKSRMEKIEEKQITYVSRSSCNNVLFYKFLNMNWCNSFLSSVRINLWEFSLFYDQNRIDLRVLAKLVSLPEEKLFKESKIQEFSFKLRSNN